MDASMNKSSFPKKIRCHQCGSFKHGTPSKTNDACLKQCRVTSQLLPSCYNNKRLQAVFEAVSKATINPGRKRLGSIAAFETAFKTACQRLLL